MKVYVVINNNHETDEDYQEWAEGVYSTEQKALAKKKQCELELLQELTQDCEREGFDNPQKIAQRTFKSYDDDTPIYIQTFILDDED